MKHFRTQPKMEKSISALMSFIYADPALLELEYKNQAEYLRPHFDSRPGSIFLNRIK